MSMACRDLNKLEDNFKRKVEFFLRKCEEEGLKIFVTETFRSTARQKQLYKKGGSFLDGVKSKSFHQLGRAADIAFDVPTYGSLYPEDMSLWYQVASIARRYGIDWGYDLWGWDMPHLQDSFSPLPLIIINEKHKELISGNIYSCKSVFNFGNIKAKELAVKHAKEWRAFLQRVE